MENQLAQLMVENNEEANINEPKWGVVLVPAQLDKVGEKAEYYKSLAYLGEKNEIFD